MSQGGDGRSWDSGTLLPRDSVLPRLVRCLRGFLNEQPCRLLFFIVKRDEIGGGGCLDGLRETRLQELLRPAKTASRIMPWMRVLAAMRAKRCAGAAMSRALLNRTQGCLRHAVLRETGEVPFERPLPNFIRIL